MHTQVQHARSPNAHQPAQAAHTAHTAHPIIQAADPLPRLLIPRTPPAWLTQPFPAHLGVSSDDNNKEHDNSNSRHVYEAAGLRWSLTHSNHDDTSNDNDDNNDTSNDNNDNDNNAATSHEHSSIPSNNTVLLVWVGAHDADAYQRAQLQLGDSMHSMHNTIQYNIQWLAVDPVTGATLVGVARATSALLRRRHFLIEKAREASVVGTRDVCSAYRCVYLCIGVYRCV